MNTYEFQKKKKKKLNTFEEEKRILSRSFEHKVSRPNKSNNIIVYKKTIMSLLLQKLNTF
jgi:hypothetical protein